MRQDEAKAPDSCTAERRRVKLMAMLTPHLYAHHNPCRYFNNEAASCNKVLKDDTELEMFGKVASTPAMFKLPDGTLAKTASAQYGEYYDEHAHAVCGLAFIFNATGVFGTDAFFNYVYDNQGTPTATSYAYAGSVHYLAGFNGRTIDGKTSVEVPLAPGAEAGNLPEATWKLLESKCKHHRCDKV
jgi:hypothetical protein